LYMCWLTPAHLEPGDAALDVLANVLAGGKNSRLYRRLVYDMQVAQDVSATQFSSDLSSEFCVITTARAGHTLDDLERVVAEELDRLEAEPPSEREVERAVNQYEAAFLDRLERVGGFGGKADQLNAYFFATGDPDYFQEDLARYRALDPSDVRAVLQTYLRDDARVVLSIVPGPEVSEEETPPDELSTAGERR
ncbi:MAG: insulinase family protein, partial [Gemmatimonadetes bacterium]|nr:insulinase family protein [Gemmatimonadota bacterium]